MLLEHAGRVVKLPPPAPPLPTPPSPYQKYLCDVAVTLSPGSKCCMSLSAACLVDCVWVHVLLFIRLVFSAGTKSMEKDRPSLSPSPQHQEACHEPREGRREGERRRIAGGGKNATSGKDSYRRNSVSVWYLSCERRPALSPRPLADLSRRPHGEAREEQRGPAQRHTEEAGAARMGLERGEDRVQAGRPIVLDTVGKKVTSPTLKTCCSRVLPSRPLLTVSANHFNCSHMKSSLSLSLTHTHRHTRS